MPAHADFPPSASAAIPDLLFGDVYPPRPAISGQPQDARTYAIKGFYDYLSSLVFLRRGAAGGPNVPFRIPRSAMLAEWPDGIEQLVYPSIVALDGRGDFDTTGGSILDEQSRGAAGPGTALVRVGEYVEDVRFEVWASTKGERRGILAALETAFNVSQLRTGLLLRLNDYWGQTANFAMKSAERSGDVDQARGRRRAIFTAQMSVVVVLPVNADGFRSQVNSNVSPGK